MAACRTAWTIALVRGAETGSGRQGSVASISRTMMILGSTAAAIFSRASTEMSQATAAMTNEALTGTPTLVVWWLALRRYRQIKDRARIAGWEVPPSFPYEAIRQSYRSVHVVTATPLGLTV